MSGRYLVTGSSGFIGTHTATYGEVDPGRVDGLDFVEPRGRFSYRHLPIDIRDELALASLNGNEYDSIIHLAARAEVITPFEQLGDLSTSNVNGTANLLKCLRPQTLVFASTSAVYGHGTSDASSALQASLSPVGTYGVSKLFGEMVLSEWCRHAHGAAIAFRFGNIIGPGCRGLIPYLVDHAMQYPEGDVPAQCRAGGRVLRDYVPVSFLVRLLWSAAIRSWPRGRFMAFNIGTGRGMTNGEIADIVITTLEAEGLRLRITWDSPLKPGESNAIVLDMAETNDVFQCPVPDREAVVDSVRQGVLTRLRRQPQDGSSPRPAESATSKFESPRS